MKDFRFFNEALVNTQGKSLFTADVVRFQVADRYNQVTDRYLRRTYADIGRDLGLSDEFVRNVLNGTREPSKAFLAATGFERVVLYRTLAE